MNKRASKTPIARNSAPRKITPRIEKSSLKMLKINNFVNINAPGGNIKSSNSEMLGLASKSKRDKYMSPIQGIPNTPSPFLDKLQNLENFESDSKKSNWYASDSSHKLSSKVYSFSDEDIKRILKRINSSKIPSLEDDHSWREFAQQQIQGVKVFKKQKCLQNQYNS